MLSNVLLAVTVVLLLAGVALLAVLLSRLRATSGQRDDGPSPGATRPGRAGELGAAAPDATRTRPEAPPSAERRVPARDEQADRAELAAAREEVRAARASAEQSRREAEALRRDAERAAAETVGQARRDVEAEVSGGRDRLRLEREELERRVERLAEREDRLDADVRRADDRERELAAAAEQLEEQRRQVAHLQDERRQLLERVAGLTAAEARAELVRSIESQAKRDAILIVRDIEAEARRTGESRARDILTTAIQRLATEQTTESVVTVVHLPGDEMKGRIIGREGRNIRAFESTTGVNVIIDDTPEAVLLSCFDPVRREVARITLERLVFDGRIHPHRIEEMYERSRDEVDVLCQRAAEDAIAAVGVVDVHPELVTLLGRLRYRTSYGQNVLAHLVESAHIAGLMAAELGMDVPLVRRAAFLHDIGKALTHEVEGSHAIVGAEVARRYGEHEDIVHAIEAHHNEVEPRTAEAVLTQAADACSGGRPGARRESLEVYVQRLRRIEEIAQTHDGVDRVFAMQAGREVRVMVLPDLVDDLHAQVIAREIAKEIEDELTYPGQIRITVVRESRAVEIAH